MVEAVTAIIASVIAGCAGGFLHSWMAFNASGEAFNGKKHGNAIITGALTGMGLGLAVVISANVATEQENIPNAVFAVGLFAIFLAAAGIDAYRTKASKMINARITQAGKQSPPPPATPPTAGKE